MANSILKLSNTTHQDIHINLSKSGQENPLFVKVYHHALSPTVVDNPDHIALLEKDSYFKTLVDSGAIVVNREARMSDEKRAVSEPAPPADLQKATEVGTVTGTAGALDVKVQQFKPTSA